MPIFPPERPDEWGLTPNRDILWAVVAWVAVVVLSCAAIWLAIKLTWGR